MVALHHLISVVGRHESFPEEFWLFCRVCEWAPAPSGVWQYYEGLPDAEFDRISKALDRFGLTEIAEMYRVGKTTWLGPNRAADLDKWLEAHAQEIQDAVFDLIAPLKNRLRHQG